MAVQRPVQRQGDALDVVVVGVAARAMPVIVVVMVVVMAAVLVMDMVVPVIVVAVFVVDGLGAMGRVHEVRLDLKNALQIEGVQAQNLIQRHKAIQM